MERDFLGIGAKDPSAPKEEAAGGGGGGVLVVVDALVLVLLPPPRGVVCLCLALGLFPPGRSAGAIQNGADNRSLISFRGGRVRLLRLICGLLLLGEDQIPASSFGARRTASFNTSQREGGEGFARCWIGGNPQLHDASCLLFSVLDGFLRDGSGFHGLSGNSAVNWPFSNKIPVMQQFMNIKVAQDERPKRSPSMLVAQRYLGIDRQGIQQCQQPSYPAMRAELFGGTSAAHHSNEVRIFPAVVTHHSIPIATSCPFFKVSGSANGSSAGVTSLKQQAPFIGGSTSVPAESGSLTAVSFPSRSTTKISGTTAQLTLFYGGMINVYDDVPLERAQAIMFLAANGSDMNSNAATVRVQKPVAAPSTKIQDDETISMGQTKDMNEVQVQENAVQPCSNRCTPMPTNPQGVAQSGDGRSSTDDLTGTRAAGPSLELSRAVATAFGSAAGASFIPKAIPQARKASLVRFLEKRKERVTAAAAPYYPLPPHNNKSPESGPAVDGKKSTTAETAHSSSQEQQSWRPTSAHKNNSSSSSSSPSTTTTTTRL